jgi:hypothetical protein
LRITPENSIIPLLDLKTINISMAYFSDYIYLLNFAFQKNVLNLKGIENKRKFLANWRLLKRGKTAFIHK